MAIQDHIIVNRLTPTHWRSNFDDLLGEMHLIQHGRDILHLMRPKVERCVRARIAEMVEGGLIREVTRDGADVEHEWRVDADNFLGHPGWNKDWSVAAGRVFARQNRARGNTRRQARQGRRNGGATGQGQPAIRLEANTIINGIVKNSNNVGNGGGMSHIMTLLGSRPSGRIGGRAGGLCGGTRSHADEDEDEDEEDDGDDDHDDDGETLVPDADNPGVQEIESEPEMHESVFLDDYDFDTEMIDAHPAPSNHQFQHHHSGRVDSYWHNGQLPPPPSPPATQHTPPLFAFSQPDSPTLAPTNPALPSLVASPAGSVCSITPSDSHPVMIQPERLTALAPADPDIMRAEFRTRSVEELAAAIDEIAESIIESIIQAVGMNPVEPDREAWLVQRDTWAMAGSVMREVMAGKMGVAEKDRLDGWDFWWFTIL